MPINNFLLPGAKVTTAYEVANSCRFNNDDSAYMHKTPSGNGTSNTTFTLSAWIKRGNTTVAIPRLFEFYNTSSYYISLRFRDDVAQNLDFYSESNGGSVHLRTNRGFRDISAWYHIVMRVDTTNGTANDRLRMYVNGVQETSFAARTNPGSSENLNFNGTDDVQYIGRKFEDSDYFDGYMAEVCYCDGQSLAPTEFGEFNEDSPTIWQPKDVSGLTFGTNGFYLDFEDSSNLGNDANGGTDFTETNLAATDQTSDTCTNNFATMNPLYHPPSDAPTLSEGNCKVVSNSTSFLGGIGSTIGVASGKWYIEVKVTTRNTGAQIGVTSDPSEDARNNRAIGYLSTSYGYQEDGQEVTNDTRGTYGATYDTDIIGIALDCDNNKIYYSKNGGWSDGDGTSDASTPNDYQTITAPASTPTGFYFFGASDGSSSATNTYEFNFGNPTFSISSGNADANGYGNFEYAVPSGYLALCTKNLGSDGG